MRTYSQLKTTHFLTHKVAVVIYMIIVGLIPKLSLANGNGYQQYYYAGGYQHAVQPYGSQPSGNVVINRVTLTADQRLALSNAVGMPLVPGQYWYDKRSGAWGYWCGPAAGLIPPGLDVGAAMPADASCGTTGVFINGREIHTQDYYQLVQLLGQLNPGRYWVDAQGNAGYEGEPAQINLKQLVAQQQQQDNVYRYKSQNASGVFSSGCSGMSVKQANGSTASAYVGC